MESLSNLLQAIAALVTSGTAVVMAWMAYQKYLKEEHIEASEDRLEVFSTSKQTTELRATENGLELHLHDIRPDRGGLQWTISPSEARKILQTDSISVDPNSRYENSGTFSIGSKRKWLYSKRLYEEPKKLQRDIQKLLEEAAK